MHNEVCEGRDNIRTSTATERTSSSSELMVSTPVNQGEDEGQMAAAAGVAIALMGVVGFVAGILCLLPACGVAYGMKEGRAPTRVGAAPGSSASKVGEAFSERSPEELQGSLFPSNLRGGRALRTLRRAMTQSQRTQQRLDLRHVDSLATFLPQAQPQPQHAQPEAEPEVTEVTEVTEAWSRWALRSTAHGEREPRPGLQGVLRPQRSGRNLPGVVAACELEMDLVDV